MKTESFIFSPSKGRHDPSVQDLSDSQALAPGALATGVFLAPSTLPAEEFWACCSKALHGALFPSVAQAATYMFKSYQDSVQILSVYPFLINLL